MLLMTLIMYMTIYGNLTYVIPPIAADEAIITGDILNNLCYQYKYDKRNRLVAKKLPGKRWEYMIYDQLDRLRATGPVKSPFKDITADGWLFTKYDAFNRPVYTLWQQDDNISSSNITANESLRNQIQDSLCNTSLFAVNEVTSDPYDINGVNVAYTNNSYPKDNAHVLTINYYDDTNQADIIRRT